MAYVQQNIADINDIASAVTAFADSRGWAFSAGVSVTIPSGITVNLTTDKLGNSANGFHKLILADAADASRKVHINSPQLAGTNGSPVIKNPTKIHLFGNDSPWTNTVPFIAGVIEFGFNNYRHFYIGKVEKWGNFNGGDIISGNYVGWNPVGTISWKGKIHRRIFGCWHSNDANASGGVLINHVDNPNPWRKFAYNTNLSNPFTSLEGKEVFGGHGDGINDALVRASYIPYAASTILVPINLYCSRGDEDANFAIRPVGVVHGAALCDLRNLEIGSSIQVGSQIWRVFPEFSKSMKIEHTRSQGYYYDEDLSYMTGIAYREN